MSSSMKFDSFHDIPARCIWSGMSGVVVKWQEMGNMALGVLERAVMSWKALCVDGAVGMLQRPTNMTE